MKKWVSIFLVALFAISAAACSKSGQSSILTIGTGGQSGTYYPLGVATAKIFTDKADGVKANAVSTDASVANINGLADGTYQLAFVQNDITYYAANGKEMFTDKKVDGIAGFGVLYPETIQIVTTQESGIKTMADLKGKKVAVGKAKSGTEANARQILNEAGITYDDIDEQFLDFGDAAQQLQDKNIDAAFITSGTPTGAVQQLGANKKINIVPIPQDVADKLKKDYPFYTDYVITKDTYASEGLQQDVSTVSVNAMLVISKKVSDELAYKLAKTFYENTGDLAKAHKKGAMISLDKALDGMPIDLHPGVKKYFDEKGVAK